MGDATLEAIARQGNKIGSLSFIGAVQFDQTMEEAFPEIDPQFEPGGQRVLVQIKAPATMTAGGIALTEDKQREIAWNTQTAKMLKMGPLAYRNRETLEPWKEGAWCKVGDYVRIPKFGGDRWEVPCKEGVVLVAVFNDLDIGGLITGDPRDVIAFV